MTDYRNGVRAAVLIIAGLCGLCVLASLSGCLTAAKIGEWQRAVHLWGMSEGASQACKDAADSAAQYIAKANTDLICDVPVARNHRRRGFDSLPSHKEVT